MEKYLEVEPNVFIEALSKELKKDEKMTPPSWSQFVKTGPSRERIPANPDWWFVRAASMLRKVSILGPVGVNKLSIKYGSKKNRGVRPEKFYRSSRNVLRTILQQLETMGLVKYVEVGVHKGRVVTEEGKKLLDSVAKKL